MTEGLRVLIAEDTEDDAVLLLHHLRREQLQPDSTRIDSREALRTALDNSEWDVVICDHNMPKLDPFAVLNEIRTRRLDVPVIVVSGILREEDLVNLMRAGAGDVILKTNLARLGPAIQRETREAQERLQLRRTETWLQEALESMSDGFALFDCDDKLVLCNERYMQLYPCAAHKMVPGAPYEELVKDGAYSGQYPDADGRFAEWVDEHLTLRRSGNHEFEQKLPDDRWVFVKDRRMPDGSMVCLRTDITERKNAERILHERQDELERMVNDRTAELKSSNDRMTAAIEAMNDGFGLVDADGRVVLANSKLESFIPGIRAFVSQRAHVSDVVQSVFPNEFKSVHQASDFNTLNWAEKQLDDGRWIIVQRYPTPDGGGIAIYTDITEAKQNREILERHAAEMADALAKEQKLNKMQREFVAMASHEFRTPLAIVSAAARRLVQRKNQLTPEEVLRRTSKIDKAVARMTELMEGTLSATRMDSGTLEIAPEKINVRELAEEVTARQAELCPTHPIKCDFSDVTDNIIADRRALDQVMTNLLSNAVKYSPDSSDIHFRGWRDGDNIYFSVEDQGVGISEDDLPKMFARYFRAESSTGIPGTGIGLNLARNLVEAHGGSINVQSREGEGSTFTVRLPKVSHATKVTSRFEVA